MFKLIKQYLCNHPDIIIKTETSVDGLIISKTLIQCNTCKKSFAQHPNQICCYVQHIHNNILYEKFIQEYNKAKQ